MGKAQPWHLKFDKHPLAACLSNHLACVDVELTEVLTDYLSILFWLHHMAAAINRYCEDHRIVGNPSSEYWLWKYAQRVDCVCNLSLLSNSPE